MEHETSSLLMTAEVIHWIALVVMALVYSLRLWWLFRFKAGKDLSLAGNPGQSNAKKGGRYSLFNVAMPWSMESTRKGFFFYLTFVIFHLGVAAGIGLAFISTIYPEVLRIPVVSFTVGGIIGAAFLVAVGRIFRRTMRPVMKLISTPDDYFSLTMLTIWFGVGFITQGYIAGCTPLQNEIYLVAYLLLTSFFLLYVPFSKSSPYLYYPFARWWIGKALGHRGSYPYARG
jgi:nitrate reductase gamma subunit